MHWRRGDLRQALHHAELMLAVLRDTGRPDWLAIALNAVGWYHALLGDYPDAREVRAKLDELTSATV